MTGAPAKMGAHEGTPGTIAPYRVNLMPKASGAVGEGRGWESTSAARGSIPSP